MSISLKQFFSVFPIFFVAVYLCFFWVGQASAIEVRDLRKEISVDPGQEQIVTIEIANDTQETRILETEVDSFVVDPISGIALFEGTDPAELWVTPTENEVSLLPGEAKKLSFTVRVPGFAEPGAHHLGLFVAERAPESQVGLGSRIGTLLFIQVAGIQEERVDVVSFVPQQSFVAGARATVELVLRNTGSVKVTPAGEIRATDMFGRTVGTAPVNQSQRTLFSGMRTEEVITFPTDGFFIGPVTVSLFATYGVTTQVLSNVTTIWVIPRSVLVLIGAAIVTVVLLRIRRHKRKGV